MAKWLWVVLPDSDINSQIEEGKDVYLEEKDENSQAAEAYKDIVARFLGEKKPHRFLQAEKKGFLKKLFGK